MLMKNSTLLNSSSNNNNNNNKTLLRNKIQNLHVYGKNSEIL